MEEIELSIHGNVFAKVTGVIDRDLLDLKQATGLSDSDLTWPSAQQAFLRAIRTYFPDANIVRTSSTVIHTMLHMCVESTHEDALDCIKGTKYHVKSYFAVRLRIDDVSRRELENFMTKHDIVINHVDRFMTSKNLRETIALDVQNSRLPVVSITIPGRRFRDFAKDLDDEYAGRIWVKLFWNRRNTPSDFRKQVPEGCWIPDEPFSKIVYRNLKLRGYAGKPKEIEIVKESTVKSNVDIVKKSTEESSVEEIQKESKPIENNCVSIDKPSSHLKKLDCSADIGELLRLAPFETDPQMDGYCASFRLDL